jgi:hypothetical protein
MMMTIQFEGERRWKTQSMGSSRAHGGSSSQNLTTDTQDATAVATKAQDPTPATGPKKIPSVRIAPEATKVGDKLGFLAELRGTWEGQGFNLIARPVKQGGSPLFLELNQTFETLSFIPISSSIPNRGNVVDDIELFGLTYLQKVSDSVTGGGGSVSNIPFLVTNANAATVYATFWIEKIAGPTADTSFLQLQYVQTVFLNFPVIKPGAPPAPLSWPHVSVATLRKTFGGQ